MFAFLSWFGGSSGLMLNHSSYDPLELWFSKCSPESPRASWKCLDDAQASSFLPCWPEGKKPNCFMSMGSPEEHIWVKAPIAKKRLHFCWDWWAQLPPPPSRFTFSISMSTTSLCTSNRWHHKHYPGSKWMWFLEESLPRRFWKDFLEWVLFGSV